MPLEPVHVMEMDRSTSRLELTRINPTRQFLQGTPQGMALYTWQNGEWYDTGSNPISAEDVPQKFRDEIAANPVRVTVAGAPEVTKACNVCGDKMNSGEMDEHLLKHYYDAMKVQQATDALQATPEKRAGKG